MSNVVVHVENISKLYKIGIRSSSLREKIVRFAAQSKDGITKLVRSASDGEQAQSDFWALKDVSFEVEQGCVLGIIGSNGAGKSTLLKILSRITEPTEGFIEIRGRVASLLEVGTGFHPELSGRENIYLNGIILGMKKKEIDARFDEIVSFAELEKFIDTPVKHYSSGMYVRLAFSVAAHMDPEILIVDEVLAVGDTAFQRKCLGKMEETSKAGRTILFVSHNLGAITSFTNKCLYLKEGRVQQLGDTQNTVEMYLRESLAQMGSAGSALDLYRRSFSVESVVRIHSLWVSEGLDSDSCLPMGSDFTISIGIETKTAIKGAVVSIAIKTVDGRRVVLFFSWDQDFSVELFPGKNVVELKIRSLPLAPGQYVVDAGINQSLHTVSYDVVSDFPLFEVVRKNESVPWPNRPWGAIHWSKVEWSSGIEK